jgi:CCR4-NOT transcription complex subunit 6
VCECLLRNRYILLDKQTIEFKSIAINRDDVKDGGVDFFNRVMPRDDVGLLGFFENRETGSRVIVANTHIVWDTTMKDVKLVQVSILLDQISKHAERYAKWPALENKAARKALGTGTDDAEKVPVVTPGPSLHYSSPTAIPLIVAGDYNSTPDSAVYSLFSSGAVPTSHPDLEGRKYAALTRDGVFHPFTLKSAYSSLGELEFTNYTPGFVGTLDYIWYSTSALTVTGVLGEIDPEYVKRVPGFPNLHYPSDHIMLQAEFDVKGQKDKRNLPPPDFGPQQRDRRDHRGGEQ